MAKAAALKQSVEPEPKALIKDRIRDLRRIPAGELRANPQNWRLHPESQRSALQGVLKEIGFVDAVIAREVQGKLELLDGHLRADLAADMEVPVLVVDLNDDEAAKVLATFDPLGTMAVPDDEALKKLLEHVDVDENAELRKLLTDLQDAALAEVEEEQEAPVEVSGMELQAHEHYDYLVVLCTTTHEWNVLCDRLGLVPEKRRNRMGTARAIRASKLLEALRPHDK